MLSPEKALDFVHKNGYDHDDAKLQELVKRRLLGHGGTIGGGSGYDDSERTEDAIVALIKCDDTDVRGAVVAGCKRMYSEVLGWAMFENDRPDDWAGIIHRLCRVVDLTGPPELRPCATALLAIVAHNDAMLSEVRTAAMRAAMGYSGNSRDLPLWERLADDPLLCAYAFTAMLDIDPNSPSIDRTLGRLLIRKASDDWKVDTTFLARRAARKRKAD